MERAGFILDDSFRSGLEIVFVVRNGLSSRSSSRTAQVEVA